MKSLITLLFFSITLFGFAQQDNPREFEYKEGDTSYTMKKYFMCIYSKGSVQIKDTSELARLQKAHLAHNQKMGEAGAVVMAGPFGDDGEKRGILLFDVATMTEAEEWIKQDPFVKRNVLTYDIHPWWGAKGTCLE